MKKIVSVIALILVFAAAAACLAGCGEVKADPGKYHLTDASGENAEMKKTFKDAISITVNDDNTGVSEIKYYDSDNFKIESQKTDLVFDPSKKEVTYDGGVTAKYTFEGNTLTIDIDNGRIVEVYEKE